MPSTSPSISSRAGLPSGQSRSSPGAPDADGSSRRGGTATTEQGQGDQRQQERAHKESLPQSWGKGVAAGQSLTCRSEDARENAQSLRAGFRLVSSYPVGDDPAARVWIITEADRSSTVLLLPEEY